MKKHLFTLTLIAFLFAACKDSDCPEPTTPAKDPSMWTLTKWQIIDGAFYQDDVFQYNFSAVSDTIDRDELSLRSNGTYIFDLDYKGEYRISGADSQRISGTQLEVGNYQKISSGTTGTIEFNNGSTQTTMNILNESSTELILGLYVDQSVDQGGVTIRQTGTIKYTFVK